jgi:Regulator of chromosome condensation (RCC1) repeat
MIFFVDLDKGELFGWGNSEYKQLLCPTSQIYSPIHIKVPQIGPIVDIAAGGSFCAVLNGTNFSFEMT